MSTFINTHNIFILILLISLGFAILIQLCYYWLIYFRLGRYKPKNDFLRIDEPVSIVVCSRNECDNLTNNLPKWLEQDYPNFEVVVVNHMSDDGTAFYLEEMAKNHNNLNIVNVGQDINFFKGKKFPLSIGIKSAKNDIIILTDADCTPNSNQWVRRMAANFTNKTEIVLGYGAIRQSKGLLNKIIRFDTLRIAMSYLSFALMKVPYMGVGRNLAYRKTLFYKQNGFISHYKIMSGDDDLFVNKAATKTNTRIEISKMSHTMSDAKKYLSRWYEQKLRHNTTGKYYKKSHLFLLGFDVFSQYLFWITSIVLLSQCFSPIIVVGAMAIRILPQIFIFKKVMNQLNEKGFLLLVPFFEVFMLLFSIYLWIASLFKKQVIWR